jgi:DHA1 family tetracycline resistance protein-like MFS transporter
MTTQKPQAGALLALFLTVFVSMTGFGVVIPIAPFFGLHVNASATEITLALGAYSLGQLIAAPFWGRLSDRIGRRPVLIGTLLATGLSYALLAQAETIIAIGLVRFAAGLAAGNIGAGFAAAADLSTAETRARAMGVVGAGFGLGFIVGPVIGGLIAGADPDQADFARVCYVALGLALAAALIVAVLLPETKPEHLAPRVKGATRALLARPVLAGLSLATLCGVTAQAVLETSFGLWAHRVLAWGPPETGLNLGLIGLLAALLQGAGAGYFARRFGAARVLVTGYGVYAAGFVVLSFATTYGVAFAGAVLLGIGVGLIGPMMQTLISTAVDQDERGAALGLNQSASALGRVVGPLAGGPLFDSLGPSAPMAFCAVVCIAALGLSWRATRLSH